MKTPIVPGLFALAVYWLTAYPVPAAETWSRLPEDRAETAASPLPVEVPAHDANLHYDGRFEKSDPQEAVCAWSASAVTLRFRGTAVNVRLGTGSNRFVAVVDGTPAKILTTSAADPHRAAPLPSPTLYAVAAGLADGEHRVTVFKCTEAFVGNASFGGFQLNAGATTLPAAPARHKIEVVGDSISCGYGNEAAGKDEHFSPVTENAWWTYGAIAARMVGADYECIAWSGRKMYPTNTIPEIYDRTLPLDAKSRWPGDKEKPDAVLVNLCTNDFRFPQLPDHDGWVKAYREFVVRLRAESPRAMIYCAIGSMMNDGYPEGRPSLTMARGWIQEVVKGCNDAGDANVRFLEFERQQAANGLGADYHPSVRTQQIMAERFVETLKADLHW